MTKSAFTLFSFFLLFLLANSIVAVKASENFWETKTSMQQARASLGVATINGKLYAIGGYTRGLGDDKNLGTNEEYDPITDTWIYRMSMPTPRSGFGIAVVDDKFYCIGGWTETNETAITEVYDPVTDTWETKTSMPTPRGDITANAVNGKIYVTGGNYIIHGEYFTTNVTEVYDPTTDSWTLDNPIPNAVSSYASVALDNKIYIIGGYDLTLSISHMLTQIYDTQIGNWSLGAPPMSQVYYGAGDATTGMIAPKRIYVLGGANDGLNQIYDPKSDKWTTGTSMPTSRVNLAVAVMDDTIYAIGGDHYPTTGPTASCAVIEQYTPLEYVPEFSIDIIVPLFVVLTLAIAVMQKNHISS